MMRALRPLFVGLAALSFLGGVTLEPYGMHGCDHHAEGPAGESAGDHRAHSEDSPMAGMGMATTAGAAGDAESPGHGDHGDSGPCTCVGDCGVTGAGDIPSTPTTAVVEQIPVAWRVAGLDSETEPSLTPVPYQLPWSNAPPARI